MYHVVDTQGRNSHRLVAWPTREAAERHLAAERRNYLAWTASTGEPLDQAAARFDQRVAIVECSCPHEHYYRDNPPCVEGVSWRIPS